LFCLRLVPIVVTAVLLASCNVYTDSLLDDSAAPENGGVLLSAGNGSIISAQGGHAAIGGSKNTNVEPPGGDAAETPNGGGGAVGAGGTSTTSGGAGPAAGQSGAAPAGGATTAGSSAGGSANPPSGVDVLDDMEDGNFYLSPKPPRFGFWYVAGDTTVGAKLPKIEELVGAFTPARDASTSAVHFTAAGFKGWGSSVGLSFTDSVSKRSAYDAGSALGISFWVRGSVSDNAKLRVLFPLLGTDPTGKQCGGTGQGQCLDHFATQVSVTSQWQQVTVLFSSLHQAGWGVPLAAFDPKQMLGIEWSAGIADVDVWLDDLALLRP
jgi:hypothetical protein